MYELIKVFQLSGNFIIIIIIIFIIIIIIFREFKLHVYDKRETSDLSLEFHNIENER